MASPMKKRAEGLKPFPAQRILKNGYGPDVWHGVNSFRSTAPLPAESKGPIPGRQARADKGLRGYGDPSWMTPTSPPVKPGKIRK